MWSSPGSKPKRGTVSGTRKVRESKPPKARPSVARLGKRRGAVIDAVEAAGGSCTLAELCGILHIACTRDLQRLPKRVSLAAVDWPDLNPASRAMNLKPVA
jgi:hypothetical protein